MMIDKKYSTSLLVIKPPNINSVFPNGECKSDIPDEIVLLPWRWQILQHKQHSKRNYCCNDR